MQQVRGFSAPLFLKEGEMKRGKTERREGKGCFREEFDDEVSVILD